MESDLQLICKSKTKSHLQLSRLTILPLFRTEMATHITLHKSTRLEIHKHIDPNPQPRPTPLKVAARLVFMELSGAPP
jgi:hypothetical protein